MAYHRSEKYNQAPAMYDRGMSIQDLAEFYQITRQAMHKILQRRGCRFRPNLRFKTENHFFRGGPGDFDKKKRAQHIVEKAVKKGILVSEPCEVCGVKENLHAHHDDYDQPLEVRWLCQKHHHEWHQINTAKNGDQIIV